MRLFSVLFLATVAAIGCGCALVPEKSPNPLRVLFVGNSLTYYNDVPTIVGAIYQAANNRHRLMQIEMLATGGATMADHIAYGHLAGVLSGQHFDVVILQDLGGYPLCDESNEKCRHAVDSVCEAVGLVRAAHAKPILYGTWQSLPDIQDELSHVTREEASRCHVQLADVGSAMKRFTHEVADISPWLDDGHPSLAGSWIAATTIARAIDATAIPADAYPQALCRKHWQGSYLSDEALASAQLQPVDDCDIPEKRVMRAAIEAGNAVAW